MRWIVLTAGRCLEIVDPAVGARLPLVDLAAATGVEDFEAGSRLNDVVADSRGRVLTGTMREDGTGAHHLYLVELAGPAPEALDVRVVGRGLKTSNGLAFSPTGTELYHADTAARRVLSYPYDLAAGQVGAARPVIRTAWPDGIAVDDAGRVWIAHWFGSKVTVWDPAEGRLLHTIQVPADRVTACAFGGPDRSDLYVTSASTEPTIAVTATGGLFRIRTNARGLRLGRARITPAVAGV